MNIDVATVRQTARNAGIRGVALVVTSMVNTVQAQNCATNKAEFTVSRSYVVGVVELCVAGACWRMRVGEEERSPLDAVCMYYSQK